MKELIFWFLGILGLGVGVYELDKHNKEQAKEHAKDLQKGKDNTDCVILPSHPDCKG